QVQLGIDPGKHPALFADSVTAVSGEVAERFQHQADLVEMVGDGVAAGVHSDLQPRALMFQPLCSFGPSQMSLTIRTPVTGMLLHCGAKLIKFGLRFLIDSGLTAAPVVKIELAEPGSQRRSEITTRCSVLRVEMLADLHPAAHQRWRGKIS